MSYNICDFGAVGDGLMMNTQAVQGAIDCCTREGGGTVLVPSGTYLCGTIILKSNVNLHVSSGAMLKCSTERKDIREDAFEGVISGAFIEAEDSHNISMTGQGTIDGQGDRYMSPDDDGGEHPLVPYSFRPRLCDIRGCTKVTITGITFKKAAMWGLHLTGCTNVYIRGIGIYNGLRGPNTDGIDPDSCKDVHISDCHIEAADDCIVLKTTKEAALKYGSCENVVVTNCTLISRSCAIKIGTETFADIRNCTFHNCIIRDTNRALGIWVRDGATVENILFSNMIIETRLIKSKPVGHDTREIWPEWWGKGEPIFISAEHRIQDIFPGIIRNVRFNNILAEAEGGILIAGCESSLVSDILLEGIRLHIRNHTGIPGGIFDLRPSVRGAFHHSTPAVYCRHAEKLTLRNVDILWGEGLTDVWTNAVFCSQAKKITIDGIKAGAYREDMPPIAFEDVRGISITKCKSFDGSTSVDL